MFAVGELAAAVVLGTHPELTDLVHLQKGARIKYFAPGRGDVTAHASITPEMLSAIDDGIARGQAAIDVPVQVLDGHGADVAELVCRFAFRQP